MTQMGGMHTRVPSTLTNSHPIATREDAEAYIKRLEGVAPLMTQAIARLEAQEAKGIRPPRMSGSSGSSNPARSGRSRR